MTERLSLSPSDIPDIKMPIPVIISGAELFTEYEKGTIPEVDRIDYNLYVRGGRRRSYLDRVVFVYKGVRSM